MNSPYITQYLLISSLYRWTSDVIFDVKSEMKKNTPIHSKRFD